MKYCVAGTTILLLAISATSRAQTSDARQMLIADALYGPFDGSGFGRASQGYQDLRLSERRWYVAYQGNRDTAPDWVNAAWAVRSAELCQSIGAKSFVILRYSFEVVTKEQSSSDGLRDSYGGFFYRVAAGPVYIPMYIPSGPSVVMPSTGPVKASAMYCTAPTDLLGDPTRAVSVESALTNGRAIGIDPAKAIR